MLGSLVFVALLAGALGLGAPGFGAPGMGHPGFGAPGKGALGLGALGLGSPATATAASAVGREGAPKVPVDRPATESPRLRRAAQALGEDPLYVDPELGWVLDDGARRRLRRALRDARVPVLVAVLPRVDEDESGGDSERTLQALQRLVRRDAVYVVADQRGWFDLASMGIPLDLSVPYSLTMPARDWRRIGEEDREPEAPGYISLPDRLQKMLRYVAVAKPGTPNEAIDDVRPLDELSLTSEYDPDEDTVAGIVLGLCLGLVAAGMVLGIRKAVIASTWPAGRGASGRGRPRDADPRTAANDGRSGDRPTRADRRRSGKRRAKAGKRWGRRGA